MEKVKTPYVTLWMEDGILRSTFAEDLHLDGPMARHCVRERLQYSEGKSHRCLIDMRGIRSVTKEAREYMAKEGAELITAGALLIKSQLTRMISNIFLSLNKPPVPVKMFARERDALVWLAQFPGPSAP